MLALRCTLLRETFEGGAPDAPTRAEWPPSWMRLFSALVGVADLAIPAERALLQQLETWPAPHIYADPCVPDAGEFLRTAWVPVNGIPPSASRAGSTTLVGRLNGTRSWARFVPRSPIIIYTWPEKTLDREERTLLASLCRRVPYLGRSTSPVVVEVTDGPLPMASCLVPASVAEQNKRFTVLCTLRVPFEGALKALEEAYRRKSQGLPGDPWAVGLFVDYGVVDDETEPALRLGPYRDLIILALDGPARDGRHAVRFTDLLRKALIANAPRSITAVHGHQQGDVVQCAFLALPFAGYPHADGHIVGLAIAIPDLEREDRAALNVALTATVERGLSSPALGQFGLQRLTPLEAQRAPLTLQAWRWTRPARRWVTVYPAVLDRYLKRHDNVDELVRQTIVNAGFPQPARVVISLRPFSSLVPGAIDLVPQETTRPGHREGFRPYRHLLIDFPVPVRGPVVVGSMRHYGLGLCLPVRDDEDVHDE